MRFTYRVAKALLHFSPSLSCVCVCDVLVLFRPIACILSVIEPGKKMENNDNNNNNNNNQAGFDLKGKKNEVQWRIFFRAQPSRSLRRECRASKPNLTWFLFLGST